MARLREPGVLQRVHFGTDYKGEWGGGISRRTRLRVSRLPRRRRRSRGRSIKGVKSSRRVIPESMWGATSWACTNVPVVYLRGLEKNYLCPLVAKRFCAISSTSLTLTAFPMALNALVDCEGRFFRDSMLWSLAHSLGVIYLFSQAIIGT